MDVSWRQLSKDARSVEILWTICIDNVIAYTVLNAYVKQLLLPYDVSETPFNESWFCKIHALLCYKGKSDVSMYLLQWPVLASGKRTPVPKCCSATEYEEKN